MGDEFLSHRIIDQIVELEKSEKRATWRWLTPDSLVVNTKTIAAGAGSKISLDERPFTISRNVKPELYVWLVAACIILIPLVYIVSKEIKMADANIPGIVLISFIVLFMFFVGYKNLTLKKLTSAIVFTIHDVTINDEVFRWDDIQDTFYVSRFTHMSSGLFVIGFKTGEIRYFDIGNQLGFKYNEKDFSRFVEHYKHFIQH